MKKLIKKWQLFFVLALSLVCGLFYFNQLHEKLRAPSEGWSKEILVKQVSNTSVNASTRVRVTTVPIPSENRFIVFWNDRTSIKYVSVNKDGIKSSIKSINVKLDEPRELKAILNKDVIDIYSLESGKLRKYSFNYKTEKLTQAKIVAEGVQTFQFNEENMFLAGDNYVKFVDKNGGSKLVSTIGGEVIDSFLSTENIYNMAFLKTDGIGTMYIEYAVYNSKNGETKTYEISKIAGSSNEPQSVDNILIGSVKNIRYIMVPIRNLKTNDSKTILYSFDLKDIKNVKISDLDNINGYNPNPIRIDQNSKGINFLASTPSIKGNKTEIINIRQYILDNQVAKPIKFLTKTDDISLNPNLFKLGNDSYIQWENITGNSTKIMFGSTNKNIISITEKIQKDELINVFLDSLMPLGFSLSYMLLLFSIIMLPTILIAIIASVFFMNWVESNNKLATIVAIGIHMIVEIILTYHTILSKPLVLALAPKFMQNSIGMYGMVLIIGFISVICVKLKYNNDKIDKSFMNQYAFFAILNMVLYALLIFPYYYL